MFIFVQVAEADNEDDDDDDNEIYDDDQQEIDGDEDTILIENSHTKGNTNIELDKQNLSDDEESEFIDAVMTLPSNYFQRNRNTAIIKDSSNYKLKNKIINKQKNTFLIREDGSYERG